MSNDYSNDLTIVGFLYNLKNSKRNGNKLFLYLLSIIGIVTYLVFLIRKKENEKSICDWIYNDDLLYPFSIIGNILVWTYIICKIFYY